MSGSSTHGRRAFLATLIALGFASAAVADEGPRVEFREGPGRLRITVGGEPLATYVYRDESILRPYFSDVYSPGGVQLTRNHPPVAGVDPMDHATFHPGLWLAFGDLGGGDYWRNRARVVHDGFVYPPRGAVREGTFAVRNRYVGKLGEGVACVEICRYAILVRPAGYLLISESEFTPGDGDFAFGDQEEMGLGIRMATALTVKNGGQIRNSDGATDEKQVRGKEADWCDYSGTIGGRVAGMTLMPSPDNFRRSLFHARDYGLLVANPFGRKSLAKEEESRVLVKRGEPFRLGFGVLLHATPAGERINVDAAYRDYREQSRRPRP